MFRLREQNSKLTSVNPRAELHGEDTKPAFDLKFLITTGNYILDHFDEQLKHQFFKPKPVEDMDLADLGTDGDHLTTLRFPSLGKLSWEYKGAGYRLTIHLGITGDQEINLIDCDIDKFKFELHDGGSVDIEFRIIAHPNEKEMGQLCGLVQSDLDISLEPPSAEKVAQMRIDEERVAIEEDEFSPAA